VLKVVDQHRVDRGVGLEQLVVRFRYAQAGQVAGEGQAAGDQPSGLAIVFVAAKGGVGSTTLAVNSALALAEATRSAVALVDLDFQHGQVATLLDVAAPATTADLARDQQSLEDVFLQLTAGTEAGR
jgi:Flp pilus assembly CpaE family ATPase